MSKDLWLTSIALVLTVTVWELFSQIPSRVPPKPEDRNLTSADAVLRISQSTGAWQYSLTPPIFNNKIINPSLMPVKQGFNKDLAYEIQVLGDYYPSDKWVEVDTSKQVLRAHQGDQIVWEFPVSTGTSVHPTPNGEYQVWIKLRFDRMIGAGYDLPNVPFVQYFYRGYGLHGTYWHKNFGHPMSHGCVNLSNEDAEKIYYWTDPWVPEGMWGLKANNVSSSPDFNPGTKVIVVGNTLDAYRT
ncbi:MAG: L,D-transpeptidase [bacterium]|nr:L,D-transpeptidase [bacterium]